LLRTTGEGTGVRFTLAEIWRSSSRTLSTLTDDFGFCVPTQMMETTPGSMLLTRLMSVISPMEDMPAVACAPIETIPISKNPDVPFFRFCSASPLGRPQYRFACSGASR
jgi:hypothetical protein